MQDKAFEEMLAFHCGPALAGIKPANLVSLSREEFPLLPFLAEEYSSSPYSVSEHSAISPMV